MSILVACPFAAARGAPPSTEVTDAEIRTLLHVNGSEDIAAQLAPAIAQAVISTLHRATPGPSTHIDDVVSNVVEGYVREQAVQDSLIDLLVPVYEKHLTKDDVEQLIAFYRSPVGRKLASVTPAISLESAKVGQQWAVSLIPGLQVKLTEALKNQK